MNFHPLRGGLHLVSSIYELVTRLFIHEQHTYGVALKTLHCRLCLVNSLSILVTVNSYAKTIHSHLVALTGYLVQNGFSYLEMFAHPSIHH